MYLKMYIKSERFYQQPDAQYSREKCYSDFEEDCEEREGGGGGGGRRCARESGGSPAHAPTAPTMPPAQQTLPQPPVKPERLSPHDNASSASRSRSVTPSTSSYPGTPPERGSPHAPAAPPHPAPAQPPRNYSDIMRSLAARYNTPHANEYFHRLNGFSGVDTKTVPQTSPLRADVADSTLGGLFTGFGKHQGGPTRLPAFPAMIDMSTTKTLLALSRASRTGRHRRKRSGTVANTEHSPLDLSAASESAAKRARLSVSPSVKSDCDERERDVRSELQTECMCAEARARLNSWSVDDVCNFVNSIDICAEYASNFREQRIDGAGLPLLTEDHLTGMLQMKLGPALKLRAVLSKRLEPCAYCLASTNHNSSLLVTPKLETKINGSAMKNEPRSNTTSPS